MPATSLRPKERENGRSENSKAKCKMHRIKLHKEHIEAHKLHIVN